MQVVDDHTPWNDHGVPFIDLIGWPCKTWHTVADTPEHCSAKTLAGVGEVVLQWIHEKAWEKPKPAGRR